MRFLSTARFTCPPSYPVPFASVFRGLIGRLRGECPDVRVALIHVVAPPEQVKERALKRAKTSGRIVPTEVLSHSLLLPPSLNKT